MSPQNNKRANGEVIPTESEIFNESADFDTILKKIMLMGKPALQTLLESRGLGSRGTKDALVNQLVNEFLTYQAEHLTRGAEMDPPDLISTPTIDEHAQNEIQRLQSRVAELERANFTLTEQNRALSIAMEDSMSSKKQELRAVKKKLDGMVELSTHKLILSELSENQQAIKAKCNSLVELQQHHEQELQKLTYEKALEIALFKQYLNAAKLSDQDKSMQIDNLQKEVQALSLQCNARDFEVKQLRGFMKDALANIRKRRESLQWCSTGTRVASRVAKVKVDRLVPIEPGTENTSISQTVSVASTSTTVDEFGETSSSR